MDMDEEEEEAGGRSLVTRQGATTAGGWNHSRVFSEAASQGATLRTAGRQTARAARTARTASRAGTRQVCAVWVLVTLRDISTIEEAASIQASGEQVWVLPGSALSVMAVKRTMLLVCSEWLPSVLH